MNNNMDNNMDNKTNNNTDNHMDARQKKILFLALLLAGCLGTGWLEREHAVRQAGGGGYPAAPPGISMAGENKNERDRYGKKEKEKIIQVYVSGAVCEPGIYALRAGARAQEALAAAGGFSADARAERVNLAQKLRDGSHVYVPAQKREKESAARNGSGSAQGEARTGKINLNTATQAQLAALPGIGPAMANRILALRRVRKFAKVEDLLQVRGIGQAKLARLRPYVTAE